MDLQASLQPLIQKLQGWSESAIATVPNLIVAILVIATFWMAGRFARRLSRRSQ